MFAPLICLLLVIIFKKLKIREALPALIAFLPLVFVLLSPGHLSKVSMTTLFSYTPPTIVDKSIISTIIFHNSVVSYGTLVMDRYLAHFSPSFLFVKGVNDFRQKILGMGMFYWSDLILLVIGTTVFVSQIKKRNLSFIFILVWLLASPLPAAITRDPSHARRALNLIYPLTFISALGLHQLVKTKNKILFIFILVFIWSFLFYVSSYYSYTPKAGAVGPAGWQYGYKQLVQYISPVKTNYQKVVVDTSYLGPYAYFLFYEKYPPQNYQPQSGLIRKEANGFGEGPGYDNYEFRAIYWPHDRGLKNHLFAGPPERLPIKDIDPLYARLVKSVYAPNGEEVFRVVETK